MTLCIIMDQGQADHVRGPSATHPEAAALEPIERQGGKFILGVEVMDDPAHAEYHDYLALLPQLDSEDPTFPPSIDPPLLGFA